MPYRNGQPTMYSTALIVGIAIVLCFTVGAVAMIVVFKDSDSTPIVTSIFGFATTIIMALLTLGKVAKVESKVDNHAEKLVEAVEKAETVADKLEEANGG